MKVPCVFSGPLLAVPLHPRHQGQGEGREAEAVPSSRPPGQGAEVKDLGDRVPLLQPVILLKFDKTKQKMSNV